MRMHTQTSAVTAIAPDAYRLLEILFAEDPRLEVVL